jgi:hypothetical protein
MISTPSAHDDGCIVAHDDGCIVAHDDGCIVAHDDGCIVAHDAGCIVVDTGCCRYWRQGGGELRDTINIGTTMGIVGETVRATVELARLSVTCV